MSGAARGHPTLTASAAILLLTLFLTWPQCLFLGTKVADHIDPHFSMWRLAWIAHALGTDPRHLYDANIFYPELRTLAYSDATLLQGTLAAPLLWSGVAPVIVYNLLLLGGIAASGVGMFVLVRHLTGNGGAAIVSAAIFTLAPYRVEHFMHLELQWLVWTPLAFLAVHRAIDEGSWRFGALAGVFVWLQILSCVYYGVFLAVMLTVVAMLLLATDARRAPTAIPPLLVGAVAAALLTWPYARPYVENTRQLGPRDASEVATYSAHLLSYATAPSQNWIWGWTASRFRGNELRLLPGVVAVATALCGLAHHRRRVAWTYLVACLAAVELSLGFNGHAYVWLVSHLPLLQGLRVPARFAIFAVCALAVLAGFGIDHIQRRLASSSVRASVSAVALMLIVLESGSAPARLSDVPVPAPGVYRMMSMLGRGVVAELPMPRLDQLPGWDAIYPSWSTETWFPLLNGYSGYYPRNYLETLLRMQGFPDEVSIARLRELNVRYIVIHRGLYEKDDYAALIERVGGRPELRPAGRYRDPIDQADLFELIR